MRRPGRPGGGLLAIAALGLCLRVAYILVARDDNDVWGDAFFYHHGANLLVDGKGFIGPYQYLLANIRIEAAGHPPLYLLFLALASLVGLDTPLAHMVWSAVLGSGTIVVSGLVGKRVAGPLAGWIAAAIVALAPNVWSWDGALLSETLAIFVATVAVFLEYRAWDDPTTERVCALGGACGAAALARSELLLLTPALLFPVVLRVGEVTVTVRVRRLVAGAAVALAVVAPWVAYNLHRFQEPVLLSSQLGPTLAGANCDDTYRGPGLGFTSTTCLAGVAFDAEESVTDRQLRNRATAFTREHLSRVPVVVAARVGRVLGAYRPAQQIDFDVIFEGRERPVAVAGLVTSYVVTGLAIAGVVVLRRRRTAPVFPLLVLPAIALITVAATYGTTRFRAPAETSLAILAAVAIDAVVRLVGQRSAHAAPE